MKKLVLFLLATVVLTSCSLDKRVKYAQFWEREQLSSSLYLSSDNAKTMLDEDLAECITFVEHRQSIEEKTLTTKQCAQKNGLNWKALGDNEFLQQCMKKKGWIPSVSAARIAD